MSDTFPNVEPGQIWRCIDKRYSGKLLIVTEDKGNFRYTVVYDGRSTEWDLKKSPSPHNKFEDWWQLVGCVPV